MKVYTVTLLNYSTSKNTLIEPITRVFNTYELAHQYVIEMYKDLQFNLSKSYYTNDEEGILDAELISNTRTITNAFNVDYESHWKAFIKLQTLKS
jgi:hypothetical protein